jgi:hypothetical protein
MGTDQAGKAADNVASSSVVMMPGEPLAGQDKYLGGALGPDGLVYGIPGSVRKVLKVVPSTGEVTYFGPDLPGKFKV